MRAILGLLFLLMNIPTVHAGFWEDIGVFFYGKETKIVRSKGGIANLATPMSHRYISDRFVWIPPRTALLLDPGEKINPEGKQLALSALGIWVYVSPTDYTTASSTDLLDNSVVLTRRLVIPLPDEELSLVLPEGTHLKLSTTYPGYGNYRVHIDSTVLSGLRKDFFYEVEIERNAARVPTVVEEGDVQFFTRAFLEENVYGFKGQRCDSAVSVVNERKLQFDSELVGGRDFRVISAKVQLSTNIGKRISESVTYPNNKKTDAFIYKRVGSERVYLFSIYEGCNDDTEEYRIELVDSEDPRQIVVNVKSPADFRRDPRKNKLLITCFSDYHKVFEFLDEDFPTEDIHFFIGLIAQWKNYGDMDTCGA